MKKFLTDAGPIRVILYILAIITIIFKPSNDAVLSLEGLDFIPTLILPVIAPLLTTGFLLDILMSRIYASEQAEEVKEKFKLIKRVDWSLAILLVAFWTPYMLNIN